MALPVEQLAQCLLRQGAGNTSSRTSRAGFGRLPRSLRKDTLGETDLRLVLRRQWSVLPWRLAMRKTPRRARQAARRWASSEMLLQPLPVFDLLRAAGAAAAGAAGAAAGAAADRNVSRAAGLGGELLRLLRLEVEGLWRRLVERDARHEDLQSLQRRYCVGQASLLRQLEALSDLDTWKAEDAFWLEHGTTTGLWDEMEKMQALLHYGVFGHFDLAQWTTHLPAVQHCMYLKAGAILDCLKTRGSWLDADVIAHILLFVLGQSDPFSRPGDWPVLDVGANVGAVSLLLLKLGFSVHAVEAKHENADHLSLSYQAILAQEVLRTCGIPSLPGRPLHARLPPCVGPLGRLRLSRFAASAQRQTLLLGEAADGATTQTRSFASDFLEGAKTRLDKVQARSLDELEEAAMKSAKSFSRFVKMDVEGFETEVLKGARQTLRRADYLFIEVWPEAQEKQNCTPGDFLGELEDFPHAYHVDFDLRSTEIQLQALNLSGWSKSWSEKSRFMPYRSNIDVLFTKQPLRVASQRFALHLQRLERVSVLPGIKAWS